MQRLTQDLSKVTIEGILDNDAISVPHGIPIILFGKHLCGSATDFGIRCLLAGAGRYSGRCRVAIAPCCHHLCSWSDIVGVGLSPVLLAALPPKTLPSSVSAALFTMHLCPPRARKQKHQRNASPLRVSGRSWASPRRPSSTPRAERFDRICPVGLWPSRNSSIATRLQNATRSLQNEYAALKLIRRKNV